MNMTCKVIDSSLVFSMIWMHTEVLDIGHRNVTLGSWLLTESGFSLDTQYWCLMNINHGHVIPYSIRSMRQVLIIDEKPLEDDEIRLITDAREQCTCYAECCSAAQAPRHHEPKSWDY